MRRRPVYADQFAQHLDDSVGTNTSRHIDRKTFACKFIDHRQTFQLLTVGAGVEDKIVGPHVIGSESRQRARPTARYPSPRPLSRHLKPCKTPDSMYAIGTHHLTLPFQENLNAPIAVARILRRKLVHRLQHRRIFHGNFRFIAQR